MNAIFLTPLLASAFTVFQVDPYNHHKYVPTEKPDGGVETTCVKSAAALGEIESASFAVLPSADLAQFDLRPSDLTGPGGATLPASAVDVAVVKAWYRPGGRWFSSWRANQAGREMMNNLVLHDDSLVRVDEEKKINYVRVDYPAPIGPKYLDMTSDGRKAAFNDELQPLRDAPAFVPIAKLAAGRYQQFWLTYRVPAGQKPGVYRGTLAATAGGKSVGSLALELTVYPFALPEPRTHYDTSRPYTLSFYGSPTLQGVLAGGKDLAKAERKFLAVCRNMAEHNVTTALGPGDLGDGSPQRIDVRGLLLMRLAGLPMRPLQAVCDGAYDFDHMQSCRSNSGKMDLPLDGDPQRYAASLARFREKIVRNFAVYDRILGHHDAYFFGPDECGVDTHRKLFGYYNEVLALGGKVYADYSDPHALSWVLSANNVAANMSHSVAWQWHRGGAAALTYAAPFCGPQCPDTWRRQKGLRFYLADYDGVCEYNFACESNNRWNDFIYRFSPYGNFGMCYLTCDGVIDTVAWNGLREGFDDVRYFSLLRLRAEAAMRSADPAAVKLGRQAIVWFDSHDPELILDLNAFRRDVAGWIERLIAKVGPETSRLPGSRAVTELPPAEGARRPADAKAGVELVKAYKAENRYDLAIEVAAAIRADASADFTLRTDAALLEAELLAETARRDEAERRLEPLAGDPSARRADRGRIYLAEVRALMTDVVFEESYTEEQLDAVRRPLGQALQIAEVPVEERISAILSYGVACVNSGHGAKTVEYLSSLVDVPSYRSGRGRIAAQIGRAFRAQGDVRKATTWLKRSLFEYGGGATLQELAETAEAAKDYQTALDAYTRWRPTIDQKEDESRYKICCRGIARMSDLLKKTQGKQPMKNVFEDASETESISLDDE